MEPIRYAQWPKPLLRYIKGVGADSVGAIDALGNASAGRLDLLCGQPVECVTTFRDLTELVARVAVANPRYQIFFRGQSQDHRIGPLGIHSLCPSLWRDLPSSTEERRVTLVKRCRMLFAAGEVLIAQYEKYDGGEAETRRLLRENPLARWAVLQHYELCDVRDGLSGTPMLDLTLSLRVAASFALEKSNTGYLYMLGMPYQREMFSVDSGSGIACVSLLGAMPSTAIRPYVQNGYLAADNDWWRLYAIDNETVHDTYHVNFAERLIAVVKIGGGCFWDDASGNPLPSNALYPDDDAFQQFVVNEDLKQKVVEGATTLA